MNIAVIGSGAVGGYFGTQLMKSSAKVYFLTSERSQGKLEASGLTIERKGTIETFNKVAVLDSKVNVKKVELTFDYIILAIKTFQLADVMPKLLSLMDDSTRILPLLNGINVNNELIAAGVPDRQIYGGLAKIISEKTKVGYIKLLGSQPHIGFGLLTDVTYRDDEQLRLTQLANLFDQSEISHNMSNRIQYGQWCKFLFVAPWGALASVLTMPIGDIKANDAFYTELVLLIKEYQFIGNAEGMVLGERVVNQIETFIAALPDKSTTSMQRDISAGKMSEFDALVEFPYQLALKHQIAVPVLKKCRATIRGRVGLRVQSKFDLESSTGSNK